MLDHDFCEHAVLKNKEGAYLAKICVAIILSLIFAICFFFFILPIVGFTVGILIFGAVCLVLWFFSRYTYIEFEYSVSGGFIDFSEIYSKQYRKDKVSIDLKSQARRIAPFCGDFGELKVSKVFDMRSSASAENSYFIAYSEGKELSAVLFDATKKSVDILFRTVPSVVTRADNLPE